MLSSRFSNSTLLGHVSIAIASVIWGLMAPLGKDAMVHGIVGIDMVTFRVVGGALCFWVASWFMQFTGIMRPERVRRRDLLLFFCASMLGVVFNQCCYTVGLSLTAPTNASIMTTTLPIITLIFSSIILREPITSRKVLGITLGVSGAITIILGSTRSTGAVGDGHLTGDMLCIAAQFSFALYMTLFKHLIQRYNGITCMKWMILFAALVITPFTYGHVCQIPFGQVPVRTWFETFFVVFMGTFVAYIFMMKAQQTLRPTVVSIYNYLQPVVACLVSICAGLGVFGWSQAVAICLVFTGVYLVNISKSRRDLINRERLASRS